MIRVSLNQTVLSPSARLSGRAVHVLMHELERNIKRKVDGNLSVGFVPEAEMRRLNREYRHKDKVTDVLAFPLNEPDDDGLLLGEVLICYPQAKRQAAERGHTTKEEVIDLLIHGTLHVLGYDHETEKEMKVMLPLQEKIFSAI